MSDLTPCPFCGAGQEELFVDTSYHGFVVSCENCSGKASMADWESRSLLVVKASQERITQLEAENERLRGALEKLEDANERVCAARPQHVYLAMVDAGMGDILYELDDARSDARARPHSGLPSRSHQGPNRC